MDLTKAVILDRDGVLNKDDAGYTHRIEDLQLIEGSAEAVRLLNDNGYYVFVVSNQSGVGRGYYTHQDMVNFNNALRNKVKEVSGGVINEFKCCTHKPTDDCKCRKPKSYLHRKLMNRYNLNPEDCYCVGDSVTDLIPADKLGMTTLLVLSGGQVDFDTSEYMTCKNLYSAVVNVILINKEVIPDGG